MNYYNEIKTEILNNEIIKRVKDYSKNRSDLRTYYNVGKLLSESRKHYGEGIIKEYSERLKDDIKLKYTERTLRRIRQFYLFCVASKWSTVSTKLNWSHFCELLKINDTNEIKYYITICEQNNLSVRELRNRIKNKEYERLDNNAKLKLVKKEELNVEDTIKNPIIINNKFIMEYCSDERITV